MAQAYHPELDLIYKAVFQCHPLGAVLYGLDHKVLHVNDNAVDLYGQKVPIGSHLESCVMAAGRKQTELLAKAMRGEPVTLEPYELVPPSGFMQEEEDPRWIKEMYNPIFHHETGALIGIAALLEDCSKEISVAVSLGRARELVETMSDLTPLVILLLDQQQLIQHANALTETLSSYEKGELVGQNFINTLFSDDHQMSMARWLLDLQTGEMSEYLDLPFLSKDGESRSMRWRVKKVPDIFSDLLLVLVIGQYHGTLGAES